MTVYDTNDKPGGMLRYSIPEFRLPEHVLERELEPLWKAGVRFVDGVALGDEITLEGLHDAGFDAIFVGVGAWQTAKSRIPGSEAVVESIDMLRGVREGRKVRVTSDVVVIGDGTAALDAARTARRLGAANVTVLARHDASGIEAGARDHAAAIEEGVTFEYLVDVKRVKTTKAGRPSGVECVRLAAGAKGKLKEVKGSRFDLAATTVISAVSYVPDLGDSSDEVNLSSWEMLEANYYTGRTSNAGVFAAGDAVTGAKSAIHAVAGGKRAALAIDACLHGVDLAEVEEQARPLQRPALPRPAQGRRAARRAESASGRAVAGLAQDGHRRRRGQAGHHAGRARAKRTASFERGRKGLLGWPPRRPRRSAVCSASAPAWASATCRSSASSTRSPATSWSCRAAACATSSPLTSTRSSSAT